MPRVRNLQNVFLNVPYDKGYEPLFITMVGALVCLGLTPRCTLEITEGGQGRLNRIQGILETCGSSIHDLSRVGLPVRFNMPFELGLACNLKRYLPRHEVVVFERVPYRIDRTVSDYKGSDPYIHNGRVRQFVGCILDAFITEHSNPPPFIVRRVTRLLRAAAREIQREYGKTNIFHRSTYLALVSASIQIAAQEGLIQR